MNNKKKLICLSLGALLLAGCSSKTKNGEFNKDYSEFVNKNIKKVKTTDYLKDSIEEKIDIKKRLDFDNTKKLSSILENLGEIDGNTYLLSNDSDDIFIQNIKNSHKLEISSFSKLNQYIQDTSNYFIFIKKNKFIKNRVKIVSIKNQEVYEKSLKNIPFSVDGKIAISNIIEQLKDISGFNVIAKDIAKEDDKKTDKRTNERLFSSNDVGDLFDNTYISFAGENVMELLDYISLSFNVYVDVDYESKTIIFQKLKAKLFNLSLSNVEYSGSLDVKKSIKNDVGSDGGDSKSVKTKIKLDILDSLENSLESILKLNDTKGSLLALNRTVGTVFIKADKETMQDMSLLINDFNTAFEKQIDFKLEIFEFAVTKDFNAGISLGAVFKNSARYVGELKQAAFADSIFNLTDQRTTGNRVSVNSATLNSKTIRLIKQTRHGYILKNSIPYFIDATDSKSYIKSITKTTSENSAGVPEDKITPEISEVNEGTVLSILAKVNGNKIEFNIQPKIVRVNGITQVAFDDNTISLPDVSVSTFTSNVILKNGEKKIIGYLTTYDDANDYSGIVPIENFILGGSRSKHYFRKETVYVISANIRE
ncbi:MAG TPA: hypothetical protein EYG73_00030 [Arcobacter sp.]|nr:hypothetical protein [Arcobacter sp.]